MSSQDKIYDMKPLVTVGLLYNKRESVDKKMAIQMRSWILAEGES